MCAEGGVCGVGDNTSPTAGAVPPLPLESVKGSLRSHGRSKPLPYDRLVFVRGWFCRREKFIRVVGVDVLGDP